MVSLILLVLGAIFILMGLGLRSLVKAFSLLLLFLGFLFLLDGALGWYWGWEPQLQLWIAGGIMVLFTIVTAIWQLRIKYKEIQHLAKQNHQQ